MGLNRLEKIQNLQSQKMDSVAKKLYVISMVFKVISNWSTSDKSCRDSENGVFGSSIGIVVKRRFFCFGLSISM